MVRDTGFEPVGNACKVKPSSVGDAPYYAPPEGATLQLAELLTLWSSLKPEFRGQILLLARAGTVPQISSL